MTWSLFVSSKFMYHFLHFFKNTLPFKQLASYGSTGSPQVMDTVSLNTGYQILIWRLGYRTIE
jgi:hypothetical protein